MKEKWELKALKATHNQSTGEQTMLGCILRAVLGKQRGGLPAFGETAYITEDGKVISDMKGRDGVLSRNVFICTSKDLEKEFRRLADHLKLDDDDRKDMFKRVVQWISKDHRVKTELK